MKLAQRLFKSFSSAYIERFPKTNKSHTNALATIASVVESDMKRTIEVEFLRRPSIDAEQDCFIVIDIEVNLGISRMDPIIHYLKDASLPNDNREAYRVKAQASRYWLSPNHKLYRRSFSRPHLRCDHPKKVQEVLFEHYEGSCGSHIGGRSIAH